MTDNGPGFVPIEGTDFEFEADLVLLAMGFVGPEKGTLIDQLGLATDERSNVARDSNWRTSEQGVFACGDMGRGQSLIVWAIAEGRACAAAVDEQLMGHTLLPRPVRPTDRPLV
jgi:glutamate synthase (NADPH/NADH) small chain